MQICKVFFPSLTPVAYGSNVWVHYATYLGAAGRDSWSPAVAITPDRHIVLGCNEGMTATLYRCSADGTALHAVRWPGTLHDIAVADSGLVAAGGSFGVRVYSMPLDSEHTQRRVSYSGSASVRVAFDPHGRLATAIGNVITLWDTNGAALSSVDIKAHFGNDRTLADIACDSNHVYAGGYRQAAPNLQTPFLYALNPSALSNRIWRSYDYWFSFVTNCVPYALTSDSHVWRVEVARNGRLYILGHADGGVSSFNLDGAIPASQRGADAAYVTRVEIDNYNRLFNSNSSRKTFFAEMDAAHGVAVRGQWLVPRWSPTGATTRSYVPGGLAADDDGTLVIAGSAGYAIAWRDQQSVNGVPVYQPGDITDEPVVLLVTSNFAARHAWAPLNKDNARGMLAACAARDGLCVFSGHITSGHGFTTPGAALASPPNAATSTFRDAYFVVYHNIPEPAFAAAVLLVAALIRRTSHLSHYPRQHHDAPA